MLVFEGGGKRPDDWTVCKGDFCWKSPLSGSSLLRKAQPTDFCWAILLMRINNKLDHMATSIFWYAKLPQNVQVIHIQLNLLLTTPQLHYTNYTHLPIDLSTFHPKRKCSWRLLASASFFGRCRVRPSQCSHFAWTNRNNSCACVRRSGSCLSTFLRRPFFLFVVYMDRFR